jgi:hypothetical protein
MLTVFHFASPFFLALVCSCCHNAQALTAGHILDSAAWDHPMPSLNEYAEWIADRLPLPTATARERNSSSKRLLELSELNSFLIITAPAAMAGLPIALEAALSDLPAKPSLTALKEIVAAARHVTRSLIPLIQTQMLPLARRRIYAAFAASAAASSIATAAAMEPLIEVTAALVHTHNGRVVAVAAEHGEWGQSRAAARAPVYFHHVSKSGGSSVCSMARTQLHCGLPMKHRGRTMPRLMNCWVKGTGPPWEGSRKHSNLDCEATIKVYQIWNATMLVRPFIVGKSRLLCTF